jgi:hypothetical protein
MMMREQPLAAHEEIAARVVDDHVSGGDAP